MPPRGKGRLVQAVTSITRGTIGSVRDLSSLWQGALHTFADGIRSAGRILRGGWARLRRSVDLLALPIIRQYSNWFGSQTAYVQAAILTLSLVMAFLLAVAAGWIAIPGPQAHEAKAQAQPADLAGVLYTWSNQRPAPPEVKCGPFETQSACQRRLAAEAERLEDRFGDYVRQVRSEHQRVVWTRKTDDFPKYNAETGELVFDFALEGKAQGKPKATATPSPLEQRLGKLLGKISPSQDDAKACTPLRIIAALPAGVTAGVWADQGDVKTRPKPFPHPCLRATEWKATAHIDSEAAKIWEERAKSDGWHLEMWFRLEDWESPLRPDWDGDARLREDDLLSEQRVWLWVDEVHLVIGEVVVQRWNVSP